MPRRASSPLLLIAAGCALFALVVWIAAFHTGLGERADRHILFAVAMNPHDTAQTLPDWIARLCDPGPYAALCAAVLFATFWTRGLRGVLVAAVILAVSNLLAEALKEALAADRASPLGHVLDASWPSGHTTAATALALCAVLASPVRWRPLVAALGALFALAVSSSVVLLDWHFPSDALGGYALAGVVTALAVAADRVIAPHGRRAQARARGRAARQGAR